MFWKLFKYDMKNGFQSEFYHLCMLMGLLLFSFISPYFSRWMILNAWICYSVLSYLAQDLKMQGIQVLIRCKKRNLWWYAKTVWMIGFTAFCYMIIYVFLFLYSRFRGILSIEIFTGGAIAWMTAPNHEAVIGKIILPWMFFLAVCFVEMLLFTKTTPIIAYLGAMLVFMLNELVTIYMLHGNNPFKYRLRSLEEYGLSTKQEMAGILFLLLFCCICSLCGKIHFKKYHLIG